VLQELNLADIAQDIDLPYRLVPLLSLGPVELSLFICEGPKTWHRAAVRDEVLLVLEGVITLEGKDHKLVVGEGEVARIPGKVGLNYFSGMRSTVVLAQVTGEFSSGNGYQAEPTVTKQHAATDAREGRPFEWRRVGVTGGHGLFATRIKGTSEPYVVPAGSVVLLVYRGVLDYVSGEAAGSVVGSQVLVLPTGAEVRFSSGQGATVVALARKGAPLPTALV
jgi:hypothetical protein